MRQDALENRERILAAAEEVFGERGASGSTEEVAYRAGVGIGTVYRHFPTKQALLEAALLRHFAALTAEAVGLADTPDPAAALRTLIRTMIITGATKMTLVSLVAGAAGLPDSVRAAARDLRAAVDVVLRRAQDVGAVRGEVTVDEVYLLIRGLAQATVTTPTRAGTLHRAIDVVLAGLDAPAPPR